MEIEEMIEKAEARNALANGTPPVIPPVIPEVDKTIPTPEVVIPPTDTPDEVVNYFKENGFEGTRDDFKPYFEKAKNYDTEVEKITAYEKRVQEMTEKEKLLEEKLTLLKDFADPLKLFNSEDEYKASLLRKQKPELDPYALQQVMTKDLNSLQPLDVLRLQKKLNDSDVYPDQSTIDAIMAEHYGYEVGTEFEDLDQITQSKIRKDAKEARKEFDTLKAEVKIPEVIDIDSFLQQKQTQTKESIEKLSQEWTPLVKKIPEAMDKIVITEDGKPIFEYNIEEDFKKSILENIGATKDWLISQNIAPTKENLELQIQNLKDYYANLPENKVKMFKAYAAQEVTKREIELKKEISNPTTGNRSQAPQNNTPEQIKKQEEVNAILDYLK